VWLQQRALGPVAAEFPAESELCQLAACIASAQTALAANAEAARIRVSAGDPAHDALAVVAR